MFTENDLISIIVPIYNSERFLAECIDSILEQSYGNIEVLLINDGSTDKTESICHIYEDKDNRIHYYHQSNHGVSVARNRGIISASGKYLMFVDSDDMLADSAVEILYRRAIENEAQLVIGGITRVRNGVSVRNGFNNQVLSGREEIAEMVAAQYKTSVASSPCCKLYSTEAVADNRFKEGISLGEDLLFNINVFSTVNKVVLVNEELYYYRVQNNNSLTNTYKDGYYEDMRLIYEEAVGYLKEIEEKSKTVINKSNVGYKFYNFAVAFIVRQIERGDSRIRCKQYIRKICEDQNFIEAINLIGDVSVVDKLMIGLIRQKRVGLIYCAAVIESRVRRL